MEVRLKTKRRDSFVLLTLAAIFALGIHGAQAASGSVIPDPNRPYLVISNGPNAIFLTAYNTIPSVSYQIQTNTDVTNPKGWGAWVTITASNTVTPLASLGLDFKEIFFAPWFFPGIRPRHR